MVAGVVGQPIAHSLSPLLHSRWIEAGGLDAVYVPFAPSTEADFIALIRGLAASGARGVNVTLPYKEVALALADQADDVARGAGAANLLLFIGGRIQARNTDGIGLIAALTEQAQALDLGSDPVVLLGAGGAARGAATALIGAGVRKLRVVNRTLERAVALTTVVGGDAFAIGDAARALDGAALIVNATSAGVGPNTEVEWPLSAAPTTAVVLDMRYGRRRTALLQQADDLGMKAIDGLGMLIGQARPSFEAFYGVAPPTGIDARALLEEAIA